MAGTDSSRVPHGSSGLEHPPHSRQVRTGQPCPWHSFQGRMSEISFELLNYKFPSWPSCRGGWEEEEEEGEGRIAQGIRHQQGGAGGGGGSSWSPQPTGVCPTPTEHSWEIGQGLTAWYMEKLIWNAWYLHPAHNSVIRCSDQRCKEIHRVEKYRHLFKK